MAVAVVAPTGIAVVALAVVPVVHAVNIQSPSGLWWASAPAARRRRPSPKLCDAELLRALDSYEGQPTVSIALRRPPHVFVRPGELRGAEWVEFDFDANIWTIPGEKMKMGRPHKVPLSRQVRELLDELRQISGSSGFLFPSVRASDRPISDNTLNAALRRLGYAKTQMTAHGFRAMASTLLNGSRKRHADAIERQLDHVESNDVGQAYLRGEHWDERVRMMQHWSDYLDRMKVRGRVLNGRSAPG